MKTARVILWSCLALLASQIAHAQSSPAPGAGGDPLDNLERLFREAIPSHASSDQAKRARCDSATEAFFDWWVPEVMNREAEPLRNDLSRIAFADNSAEGAKGRLRAFNRLAPSMSILTSKLMIAETYRVGLERRCLNSSQQDEVAARLSSLMGSSGGGGVRTLDGIIAQVSELSASAGTEPAK
jgi:hypothetical protein